MAVINFILLDTSAVCHSDANIQQTASSQRLQTNIRRQCLAVHIIYRTRISVINVQLPVATDRDTLYRLDIYLYPPLILTPSNAFPIDLEPQTPVRHAFNDAAGSVKWNVY